MLADYQHELPEPFAAFLPALKHLKTLTLPVLEQLAAHFIYPCHHRTHSSHPHPALSSPIFAFSSVALSVTSAPSTALAPLWVEESAPSPAVHHATCNAPCMCKRGQDSLPYDLWHAALPLPSPASSLASLLHYLALLPDSSPTRFVLSIPPLLLALKP